MLKINKQIVNLVLSLILILTTTNQIWAHHFAGGIFSYTCVSNQEVIINLGILIEEETAGSSYDNTAYVSVYLKANGEDFYEPYREFSANYNSHNDYFSPPDLSSPVKKTLYTFSKYSFNFDQFDETGEYLFVYQRCCKTTDLTNLMNSGMDGSTVLMSINYQNESIVCNNTPTFSEDILMVSDAGVPFEINLPIEDADGDSLVYSFSPLPVGGSAEDVDSCFTIQPLAFCPPPYDYPIYQPGYSFSDPFGPDNQVTLDPITGVLSGTIDEASRFVFGIQIEEYRNGELLGIINFEQQLNIQDPNICIYDLVLNSQEEVNILGAFGCPTIPGNLTIMGTSVVDLSPLSNIDSIYGSLVIKNLANITSGLELSSLQYIGADLTIVNTTINNSLPLSNLNYIGGDLLLNSNDQMTSLSFLENVNKFASITLNNCPLINLQGLEFVDTINQSLSIENINFTEPSPPWNLKYIGGNLKIVNTTANTSFPFPNLNFIRGSVLMRNNNQMTNLSLLENVDRLTSITIENCPLNNLRGLEQVDTIDQNLTIINSSFTTSSPAFNLKYVGATVTFENLNLPNFDFLSSLNYIGGSLYLEDLNSMSDLDGFNNLITIGNQIDIVNNDSLINLRGFQQLQTVGDITIRRSPSLISIHSFPNLLSSKDIRIKNLDNLVEIIGFENLNSSASIFLEDLSRLTELSRFDSLKIADRIDLDSNSDLTILEGFNSLENATSIEIINLNEITSINGFHNLINVENSVMIVGNNILQSVIAFDNINTIGSELQIRYNDELTTIDGFQNLSSIGEELAVYSNSSLNNCDIFCPMLLEGFAPASIKIGGNAESGTCLWPGLCGLSIFNGRTFIDEDGNGERSYNEIYLQNTADIITLSPAPTQTLLTDNTYIFHLEVGDYEVISTQNSIWNISTPPVNFLIPEAGTEISQDIGLVPNGSVNDTEISLVLNGTTRCDAARDIILTVKNGGNEFSSGQVLFIKNQNIGYNSLFSPLCCRPDSISGDSIFWNFENLAPTFTKEFELKLFLPSVDFIGDTLIFASQLLDENGSVIDTFNFEDILICSYDPNDKLTHPDRPGKENYTLFEEELIYTIRFENLGNAEAINVRVEDQITTGLDLNSFQLINTSHPMSHLAIDPETRKLTFYFNNILLGPGTGLDGIPLDKPNNKGFIQFKIKPIDNLAEYAIIQNQASIFFDSNEPIITNKALNTFVSEIPTSPNSFTTDKNELGIRLFPNPSASQINILPSQEYLNAKVEIFNMQGQIITSSLIDLDEGGKSVDFDLAAGVYIIRISDTASEKKSILKFVVIN